MRPVYHVEGFRTPQSTVVICRPRTVNISLCLCGRPSGHVLWTSRYVYVAVHLATYCEHLVMLMWPSTCFQIVSLHCHLSCTIRLASFTFCAGLSEIWKPLCSLRASLYLTIGSSVQRGQSMNTGLWGHWLLLPVLSLLRSDCFPQAWISFLFVLPVLVWTGSVCFWASWIRIRTWYLSVSTRYGSGSFCNQAKIVRKTLIPTVTVLLLLDFYLWKMM